MERLKNGQPPLSTLGISPLVAAVLLIAITMTIAGVLAYWATSFVKTSLPETNTTEAECRLASFSIYSCSFDNSTKKINLILENLKNIELRNLRAFVIYENGSVSDAIPLNTTLGTVPLKSFVIANIDNGFSKLRIKTHCPELSEEKACTRTG